MMLFDLENHGSFSPFPQKSDFNPSSCSTIFFTTPKSTANGVSFRRRLVQLIKAASTSLAVGFPYTCSGGVSRPEAPVDEVGDRPWCSSATTSSLSPSLSPSGFAGSGEANSIKSGEGGLSAFLKATFAACRSGLFFGRHGMEEMLLIVLRCAISWLLRQGRSAESLTSGSLLNTFLNSVHLNFDMMVLNSYENGGPLRILIREETSVSMKKEFRNDA
jgi:hypothetical protein